MICLPYDVICNPNLTDEEVALYAFVQIQTYSSNYDSTLFNATQVIDQMGDGVRSQTTMTQYARTLTKLMEKGVLDIKRESQKCWRIWMTTFKDVIAEGHFITVEADEIRGVFECTSYKRATTLRLYFLILTTLNSETGVGTHEQTWFAEKMRLKPQSIGHHLSVLEKNHYIYVYRAADFYTSNTYGRYEDKENIEIVGRKRSGGHKKNKDANLYRKYITMFHKFERGDTLNSDDLIRTLEVMQQRQKERKKMGEDVKGKDYDLTALEEAVAKTGISSDEDLF